MNSFYFYFLSTVWILQFGCIYDRGGGTQGYYIPFDIQVYALGVLGNFILQVYKGTTCIPPPPPQKKKKVFCGAGGGFFDLQIVTVRLVNHIVEFNSEIIK